MCFVLLVEDNSTFRKALRDMLALRFPGLEIQEASDGEQALRRLNNTNPDIIFIDIKLPGKNGLELTRIIKEANPEAEVVILSSYDLPEYKAAACRNGATHFLTKGNSGSDQIADTVRSIFQQRGKDRRLFAGFPISEDM